ncbi:hypothetical protein HYZ98_00735 [Candidatus Peregrinibacteria bacterium]|nr:hypothetical protein [Candidatus Peregrinibacteria bacterium]
MYPAILSAAIFGGGGVAQGIGAAGGIVGLSRKSIRGIITDIAITVINFAGLAATATIIAAGFMLIFDWGNDQLKERAKKAMIYCIIGLVVLLFVRAIIFFVLSFA